MKKDQPEVWLRGPVPGVPALLQPVAHALLQAREDVIAFTEDFPGELLWEKPAGMTSAGFHLQHLSGVLDRMLTYAADKPLSEAQFTYLRQEGDPETGKDLSGLVSDFQQKTEEALEVLKQSPEAVLLQPRPVGKKKLPSTVIGLLFHAAEHSQRHVGQLLVTLSVLKERYLKS